MNMNYGYNFSPGISPTNFQNNIAPANSQGALLSMLGQLVQHRLGVTSMGANRVPIAIGQSADGFTDAAGNFHFGTPGF